MRKETLIFILITFLLYNKLTEATPQFWDNSTNSTTAGKPTEFRLRLNDTVGLSGYIFSFDNATNNFVNDTWVSFPQPDSTDRECNVVGSASSTGIYCDYGDKCNEDSTDATMDTCADGIFCAGSEWVWNITINATIVEINDVINVSCYFHCYDNDDEWAIAYREPSGSWVNKDGGNCAGGIDSDEVHSTSFGVGSNTGTAYVRCMLMYYGSTSATCGGDEDDIYSDTDDLNFTITNPIENWSNVTQVINSTVGATIRWKVYANDTSNSWNASDTYSFVTIDVSPKYFDNSTNSTRPGKPIEFRLRWTDDRGLSHYTFSLDNCTGSFNNITSGTLTGCNNWSNVTQVINPTAGCTIRWKVYANDSSDNWNVSDTYSFIARGGGAYFTDETLFPLYLINASTSAKITPYNTSINETFDSVEISSLDGILPSYAKIENDKLNISDINSSTLGVYFPLNFTNRNFLQIDFDTKVDSVGTGTVWYGLGFLVQDPADTYGYGYLLLFYSDQTKLSYATGSSLTTLATNSSVQAPAGSYANYSITVNSSHIIVNRNGTQVFDPIANSSYTYGGIYFMISKEAISIDYFNVTGMMDYAENITFDAPYQNISLKYLNGTVFASLNLSTSNTTNLTRVVLPLITELYDDSGTLRMNFTHLYYRGTNITITNTTFYDLALKMLANNLQEMDTDTTDFNEWYGYRIMAYYGMYILTGNSTYLERMQRDANNLITKSWYSNASSQYNGFIISTQTTTTSSLMNAQIACSALIIARLMTGNTTFDSYINSHVSNMLKFMDNASISYGVYALPGAVKRTCSTCDWSSIYSSYAFSQNPGPAQTAYFGCLLGAYNITGNTTFLNTYYNQTSFFISFDDWFANGLYGISNSDPHHTGHALDGLAYWTIIHNLTNQPQDSNYSAIINKTKTVLRNHQNNHTYPHTWNKRIFYEDYYGFAYSQFLWYLAVNKMYNSSDTEFDSLAMDIWRYIFTFANWNKDNGKPIKYWYSWPGNTIFDPKYGYTVSYYSPYMWNYGYLTAALSLWLNSAKSTSLFPFIMYMNDYNLNITDISYSSNQFSFDATGTGYNKTIVIFYNISSNFNIYDNNYSTLTPVVEIRNNQVTATRNNYQASYNSGISTIIIPTMSKHEMTLSPSSTDGSSCLVNSDCNSNVCCHNICRSSCPYCSDGYCDSGETCSNCPVDCGSCPRIGVDGGFPPEEELPEEVKEIPEEILECPICSEPTEWSECVNNKQIRTNYRCGSETNYVCESYTETRSCEVEKKEIKLILKDIFYEYWYIGIIAVIIVIIILYRSFKFKKKLRLPSF